MKLSRSLLALAFLSSLFVLAASITRGQTSRGTLTGTVTDISGAVIAKAASPMGILIQKMTDEYRRFSESWRDR